MHEYSIMEQVIESINTKLKEEKAQRVKVVNIRMGGTFQEGPVRQAFEMLVENTPLKETELVIEPFELVHNSEILTNDLHLT
ncbi:MAG: hydrogenase/urease maturation nickel metallochaperone HypA [bacterium]|nr:hydrogenase/urease maturation nickel metallochaperone HypA [bacterium]